MNRKRKSAPAWSLPEQVAKLEQQVLFLEIMQLIYIAILWWCTFRFNGLIAGILNEIAIIIDILSRAFGNRSVESMLLLMGSFE